MGFLSTLSLPWMPLYVQDGLEDTDDTNFVRYYALAATIAFTVTVHFWESHLDMRQQRQYGQKEFPSTLKGLLEPLGMLESLQSKFQPSQSYGLDKVSTIHSKRSTPDLRF